MPLTAKTVHHVTMTAKVTVQSDDPEVALKMAKEAITAGQADVSWSQEKQVVQVYTPAAPAQPA